MPEGRRTTRSSEGRSRFERFSLHQGSVPSWSLRDLVTTCEDGNVSKVALLAPRTRQMGVPDAADELRRCGIVVTSYSAAGYFAAGFDPNGQKWTFDDSLRVLDEAGELATDLVVVVSGPMQAGMTLDEAYGNVRGGLDRLVPAAAARGLRLAFEPAHPMFCPDRSVICSLGHAAMLVSDYPSDLVGIDVDYYQVWWDARLAEDLWRWRDRVLTVQLSDWLFPAPDRLLGRGLMGSGWGDVANFIKLVDSIGYEAPFEVEVLNADLDGLRPEVALDALLAAFIDVTT